MTVDIDFVRQLTEVLNATRLTNIEVSHGDQRICISREPWTLVGAYAAVAAVHGSKAESTDASFVANPIPSHPMVTVRSPHVGIARLASRVGEEPFAPVGRTVSAGDTLLLVEMMKVKVPIVASSSGVVIVVLIDDGKPVEFDQPLIVLN